MAIFENKTSTSAKAAADKEEKKQQKAVDTGSSQISVPVVLLQPRISEKSSKLAAQNKYVFNVKIGTNKVEIKKAVEHAYKVKVTQVNIIKMEGKHRNYGKTSGTMSDFKKAIVSLKAGDKIEGVTEII